MMKRNYSTKAGEGNAVAWLRANADHSGQDCLIWPFSRMPTGYGAFGFHGKHLYAHRFMCELIHGKAPTSRHEAAHACGNGKDGCVHPQHLSWKTPTENAFDSSRHGTGSRNKWGSAGKLTRRQVAEIWAAKGQETQQVTAERYDVSASTIRDIYLGRTHVGFTAVALLRELSLRDLGHMPNYSSGLWSRRNLEAMIDDLVADTNDAACGQTTRDECLGKSRIG
jgi:hypothetical protein